MLPIVRAAPIFVTLQIDTYLFSLAKSVQDARRLLSPLDDEALIKFDDVKANNQQVQDDISA